MFLVSFIPTRPKKFAFDYTVTAADVEAGHIDSTITAKAVMDDGTEAIDTYDVTLLTTDAVESKKAEKRPDNVIRVTKTASKTSNLKEGETVTFTVQVENKGKQTLRDVVVEDTLVPSVGQEAFTIRPQSPAKAILAILTGLISSFGIGALFSVAYSVPAELAAEDEKRTGVSNAAMYFAVQGLFSGVASGIGSYVILTALKKTWTVEWLTLICAIAVMVAFALTFLLPKSIKLLGKESESK